MGGVKPAVKCSAGGWGGTCVNRSLAVSIRPPTSAKWLSLHNCCRCAPPATASALPWQWEWGGVGWGGTGRDGGRTESTSRFSVAVAGGGNGSPRLWWTGCWFSDTFSAGEELVRYLSRLVSNGNKLVKVCNRSS